MDALNLSKDDRVKLKPCPFCGGTDISIEDHYGGMVYSVRCCDCGATFPNRYKRELLVSAWNRRHEETPSEFDRLCGKDR